MAFSEINAASKNVLVFHEPLPAVKVGGGWGGILGADCYGAATALWRLIVLAKEKEKTGGRRRRQTGAWLGTLDPEGKLEETLNMSPSDGMTTHWTKPLVHCEACSSFNFGVRLPNFSRGSTNFRDPLPEGLSAIVFVYLHGDPGCLRFRSRFRVGLAPTGRTRPPCPPGTPKRAGSPVCCVAGALHNGRTCEVSSRNLWPQVQRDHALSN